METFQAGCPFCFVHAPLVSGVKTKGGLRMRLLILVLVLIAGGAFIQSERNHCHWDGPELAVAWAECLIR